MRRGGKILKVCWGKRRKGRKVSVRRKVGEEGEEKGWRKRKW